ncbi:hypothetical protein ACFQ67_27390 [Streptomyces sp. NPDC056488]|uniref:hypothetical protein n=1 Tax=Streptomyces sp. NPDC056488 TaxID=3345836 RepID=UPI0036A7C46E
MLQCTAVHPLPPPETLLLVAVRQDAAPNGPVSFLSDHMLCEFGEGHDGSHADLLWETGTLSWETGTLPKGVWARWADSGAVEFVPLPWCGAENETGEWCAVLSEHPPGHKWEVTDPTRTAFAADVIANPEKYGLPPRPPGLG